MAETTWLNGSPPIKNEEVAYLKGVPANWTKSLTHEQ